MTVEEYRYPIRITENAEDDIQAAYTRFEKSEGVEIAEQWRQGLFAAVVSLSLSPFRPLVREQSVFTKPVRFISYRRTRHSVAYRVLFVIVDADLERPFVRLVAVRHGAQSDISTDEARQIEEGK